MKRYVISLLALALLLITVQSVMAQQPYTDEPDWRVMFVRAKSGQLENYLKDFKEKTIPALEEGKKQGLTLDYKILLNTKKADPQDWNILRAYQLKDQPALDSLPRKKMRSRTGLAARRAEMREHLRVVVVKEITLK